MNEYKKSKTNQQREEQHEENIQHQAHRGTSIEFPTVEELLRHDATQTPVPPSIAQRLQESTSQAPPKPGWWKRLFGSSEP